jgi:hypothetical protein
MGKPTMIELVLSALFLPLSYFLIASTRFRVHAWSGVGGGIALAVRDPKTNQIAFAASRRATTRT